jgi:hypothetical protein
MNNVRRKRKNALIDDKKKRSLLNYFSLDFKHFHNYSSNHEQEQLLREDQ